MNIKTIIAPGIGCVAEAESDSTIVLKSHSTN